MRKIYIIVVGLMASCTGLAQQFKPLRIDSAYSWLWVKGYKSDTLISIDRTAYTYNVAGRLSQKRITMSSFNYNYHQDTLLQWIKTQTGEPLNSTTAMPDKEKQASKWRDYFLNDQHALTYLCSYTYDKAGRKTLDLVQQLDGNAWVNLSKTVRKFDSKGNKTEEADYETDKKRQWTYKEGFEIEYDLYNRPVKKWQFLGVFGEKQRVYEEFRHYDGNNRLDTLWQCRYHYPFYDVCEDPQIKTYQYTGSDSIVPQTVAPVIHGTVAKSPPRNFAGTQVHSTKTDSIPTVLVSDKVVSNLPANQRFEYKNLDNGVVYFRAEQYDFILGHQTLTKIQEEWYHAPPADNLGSDGTAYVATCPNSCKAGQQIYFKKPPADDGKLDVLIFNGQGQMVAQLDLSHQLSVPGPATGGVYSVLIRKKDSLAGISKLVVVN